jgi:hypothetical protein
MRSILLKNQQLSVMKKIGETRIRREEKEEW